MTEAWDYSAFFAAEGGADLGAFAELEFGSVCSWSEIELWAAATGTEIGPNFAKALATAGTVFPAVSAAMEDAVRSTKFLDDAVYSVGFAASFYKIWSGSDRMGSHAAKFVSWYASVRPSADSAELYGRLRDRASVLRRMYGMLDALDMRFPSLLPRFYAANFAFLHGWDSRFCDWLIDRMPAKIARYPEWPAFSQMYSEMLKTKDDAMFREAFVN